MKCRHRILDSIRKTEPELVATFGEARLVRHPDGTVDLIGGRERDRDEAREWCTLFMKRARWRR